MKNIEEITEQDLEALWPVIGGTSHLFEYGKDELKQVLITGECGDGEGEPIGLQLDFYTMAAIVDTLRARGFETSSPAPNKDKGQPIEDKEEWHHYGHLDYPENEQLKSAQVTDPEKVGEEEIERMADIIYDKIEEFVELPGGGEVTKAIIACLQSLNPKPDTQFKQP
jgi:hypothetical protein